jgi:hypothetical protein
VVVRLLEKLRRLTEPDEGRLHECLSMLEILADNRHLTLNLQEAYGILATARANQTAPVNRSRLSRA